MKTSRAGPNEVTVAEAHRTACAERPILDIRTTDERRAGGPAGAIELSEKAVIEACAADPGFAGRGGAILCAEGVRSLALVERLRSMGYDRFRSVRGGMIAWLEAGLPIDTGMALGGDQAERYARHLVLPEVGAQGQRRLLNARVLLAGLGGLGSPAALYLAAAGVGTLGLLDHDTVARSNLQRQVLHADDAVGTPKTGSAADRLRAANPGVRTELIDLQVTAENAGDCVRGWDVVIDGTDNFAARYALNDACVGAGIPLVYGAVMRFQGQVSVFRGQPCFRCLMPAAPEPGETPSCAEAGVLGVLPGIVGTLQAAEALKLLLGIGNSLAGHLLMFDALDMEFRKMRIGPRDDCPVCGKSSCNNRE